LVQRITTSVRAEVVVAEQPQENPVTPARYRDAEAQLGGADAVEKTTYIVGEGTDPNVRKGPGPSATVPSNAPRIVAVVVGVLVVLVALAYLIGIFR
jgi:hypothetical protein